MSMRRIHRPRKRGRRARRGVGPRDDVLRRVARKLEAGPRRGPSASSLVCANQLNEESPMRRLLDPMNITADTVKQLRERTGAGMMECKKALVETQGDLDAAA